MKNINQIAIYQSKNGKIDINIDIEHNTIWLSQEQIALLFGTQRPAITKHLRNIFLSKELNKKAVCSKMEHTANDRKKYTTQFYNLDAIISIGYRVNSLQATQFRIWATKILKQYLVKGYAINQKRLKEQEKSLKTLSDSVALIKSKIKLPVLAGQENELLEIIKNYVDSLRILKLYDDQKLSAENLRKTKFSLDYEKTITSICQLKTDLLKRNLANDNFGRENGQALKGLVGAISQTFDNKELYPSIEEKAANLLYFVIKDHPFIDGNKRIGSTLFIYFLNKNNYLFKKNGEAKINDRALVALALLIAVSDPKEKNTIIKLVINLIKN